MNNDVCDIQRADNIGVIGSFKPGGQEKAVLVLKVKLIMYNFRLVNTKIKIKEYKSIANFLEA